jgi:hypothetical protein
LWDLAYAAISFGHLFPGTDVRAATARLTVFIDGYDADAGLRNVLSTTMTRRARAMYDMLRRSHQTGQEPWGTMYADGHGKHWLATTEFIARHQRDRHQAVAADMAL